MATSSTTTPLIGLSNASIYPESTSACFEMAQRLGYDGVEIMVGMDPTSADEDGLARLSDYHQMPVLAIHAPCLLLTQRVWGTDPWGKLERSAKAAQRLGAATVVVHPPFRWQREYAKSFISGIARIEAETGITIAVENMYPWRASSREMMAYSPGWDVTQHDFAHFTLDLSHAATARQDCLELAYAMGERLRHLHITDGSGSAKDEHLVPGRGTQRAPELLQHLAGSGFDGHIVVEINTRRCPDRATREADVAQSLAFTKACWRPTVRGAEG